MKKEVRDEQVASNLKSYVANELVRGVSVGLGDNSDPGVHVKSEPIQKCK